jgi:hypothetical protein
MVSRPPPAIQVVMRQEFNSCYIEEGDFWKSTTLPWGYLPLRLNTCARKFKVIVSLLIEF